jgi:hypothetical protein
VVDRDNLEIGWTDPESNWADLESDGSIEMQLHAYLLLDPLDQPI